MVEQMKPSGIDWIGDIPQSWKLKRYKYCGYVQYGYPFDSNYFTNEETGFPLIRIRDITSGNIETYYEGNYPKEYIVQKGDVLIGMDGDFNIRIWDNEKALLNQRCCRILDHKQTSKRFMSYYLSYQLKLINDLTWSTTVKHLLAEDIKNIFVSLPKIEEQQAIAEFLDKQCGKIDSIISDLEKQIETLQKYKKSLILETVTKGLNKNAPMKPSGIDWIGDIPAHWETSKIKYNIGLIGSGTTPESGNPLYYEDGKYNWIQSGDLYRTDYINSTEKQLTALAIKDSPALTYYEKDFVVIAMYGASVGNVSISKIDAYTNQACCVIKAKNNDDIRYLFYYLKAAQDEMLLKAFGGTQPNISQIIIKNLNCLKVPNVEQKSISDYLDDKCGKIDSILKDKQEQLEKIKQHKKSLIYEYVTGKKRVKEAINGN